MTSGREPGVRHLAFALAAHSSGRGDASTVNAITSPPKPPAPTRLPVSPKMTLAKYAAPGCVEAFGCLSPTGKLQRTTTRGAQVKYWILTAFLALCAAAFLSGEAQAAGRCVAYGDESTDFTWRLCPGGEKYERQYLYFGFWSSFHRVNGDAGVCRWSPRQSSWQCPDRTIRCDANHCRAL